MSTFETYAPLAHDIDVPADLSTRMLLEELRQFACNKPSFRTGLVDELYIRTMEGDATDPHTEGDVTSVGYKFYANRLRGGVNPRRSELTYGISVIAVRDAIALPAHLAIEHFVIDDPAEAVEEAGLVSLEHETKFTITNVTRELEVCESYAYMDDDQQVVNFACTCATTPPRVEAVDGQNDSFFFTSGIADEIDLYKIEHEALPPQTPGEEVELWARLMDAESSFTEADQAAYEDALLRQAYAAFVLFKRSLRRQLGIPD